MTLTFQVWSVTDPVVAVYVNFITHGEIVCVRERESTSVKLRVMTATAGGKHTLHLVTFVGANVVAMAAGLDAF